MRFLFLSLIFLIALPASAAEALYVQIAPGTQETVYATLYMAGTSTPLNTFEGTLVFPEGTALSEVSTGKSVALFWVEPPTVKDNTIHFSGVIPGGFTGVLTKNNGLSGDGSLFTVRATKGGSVRLTNAAVYKNDGEGTRILLPEKNTALTGTGAMLTPSVDTTIPQWVTAERIRDPNIAGGAEALIVSAIDKESGIDYFEVQEGNGSWKRGVSPYVLEDQLGASEIHVRVYDHAGNMREVSVAPRGFNNTFWLLLLTLAILGIFFVYWKKRRK